MPAAPKPQKRVKTKRTFTKSERTELEAKLDTIVSEIVRQRDGHQCVLCWSRSEPTNGHIIPRAKMGTRWDLLNCHCQCAECNAAHNFDDTRYITWFKQNFGAKAWEELNRRKDREWSVTELRELLECYQDLQERLGRLGMYDRTMLIAQGAYGKVGKE